MQNWAMCNLVDYLVAHLVLCHVDFCPQMLDEAQLVANSNSVAAQMASSLWRRHAWVVTGEAPTPCRAHPVFLGTLSSAATNAPDGWALPSL